jgi:hypothetical protein
VIRIAQYTIMQTTLNVVVEYEYSLDDPIAGGQVVRRSMHVLSQLVAPLDAPDWGDAELCAALATAIGQPVESVEMSTPDSLPSDATIP